VKLGLGDEEVPEVRVFQGLTCRDSLGGVVREHFGEEIEAVGVQVRHRLLEGPGLPAGEVSLVVGEGGDARPDVLGRGSKGPEDFENLVDFRVAREEGVAGDHLGEDAANAPDIDGDGVVLAAEEDLRGAVPEGDDLVCVGPDGDSKGPGEPKVGQLEGAVLANEEIVGLEVAVEDAACVAVVNALEHLVQEALGVDEVRGGGLGHVHVLLQVTVEEFEHQVELGVVVNDINQPEKEKEEGGGALGHGRKVGNDPKSKEVKRRGQEARTQSEE